MRTLPGLLDVKLAPSQIIGAQVNQAICTAPPAQYYPYVAGIALQLKDGRVLVVRSSTIFFWEPTEELKLFPAAGWNHSKFLQPELLDELIAGNRIKRLIRTRDFVYDHSMVVMENRIVLGNCETSGNRILYVRTTFDDKREVETQYWDYFSDQPVNHLGDDVEGERRRPCRVSWV